jgi:hypothetical protein
MTSPSRKWTKAEIAAMLQNNDIAVERGIVAIFNRQTEPEVDAESTHEKNGIGFSAFHARLGSYYGKWITKGHHLDGKHLEKGRRLILHYAGQLTRIANGEV